MRGVVHSDFSESSPITALLEDEAFLHRKGALSPCPHYLLMDYFKAWKREYFEADSLGSQSPCVEESHFYSLLDIATNQR